MITIIDSFDRLASFLSNSKLKCRRTIIMIDKINDYLNSPEDLKQLISKNSRKNKGKIHYSEKSIPISPTPNSLVSETPRGKKCTAEEESNQ